MKKPNDYNQYLDIAAGETPERAVTDAYFTATCPRYDAKTGEAETPLVVTVRRQELRGYHSWLLSEVERIKDTYDDFGLNLPAIIAAEEAAAAAAEGEGE